VLIQIDESLAKPVKLFSVVAVSLCVLWLSAARSERFNPYKPVTLIAFMCEGIACTDEPVPPKTFVAGKVEDAWQVTAFPSLTISTPALAKGYWTPASGC
jgi:hypothetical protein